MQRLDCFLIRNHGMFQAISKNALGESGTSLQKEFTKEVKAIQRNGGLEEWQREELSLHPVPESVMRASIDKRNEDTQAQDVLAEAIIGLGEVSFGSDSDDSQDASDDEALSQNEDTPETQAANVRLFHELAEHLALLAYNCLDAHN